MTKKESYKQRWKLHSNVSRNAYVNSMIGRYGGCFEEDIMRFMCERAYRLMGFGCTGEVCTTSRGEIGQCTVPKRLAKYKVIGGSARNRILTLVQRTHPLIIGNSLSNQEIHEQPCISRRVYGGLVILAHRGPYYGRGYLRNQYKCGSNPETKFSALFLVLHRK